LISGYVTRPNSFSEGGIAWSFAEAAGQRHNVWVITRRQNRRLIEEEIARNPRPNLNFVYYDLPPWVRKFKREGKSTQIYYYLWQMFAASEVRRLMESKDIDIGHHITLAKYWAPSLLAFVDLPYVWGSVGGGESAPASFMRGFGLRGCVYEFLRNTARWIAEHDPFVRITARRCARAIGATDETSARLRHLGVQNAQTLPQIALTGDEIEQMSRVTPRRHDGCRFISIGRLLHWKGFHLGIEGFAKANIDSAELWIVGDGPERGRLEQLAARLGVAERVRFLGSMPREATLERLAQCDVLVHPSLHESGGMVCLEAMASGCPVICLDLGGPALQVTDETGIRIVARNPDQTIEDMAEAMVGLAGDADRRQRMGDAGRCRVRSGEYHWNRKIELYSDIYYQVLDRRPARDSGTTSNAA
jgi:glycosyltransferase involved in cell wall biosynthesis